MAVLIFFSSTIKVAVIESGTSDIYLKSLGIEWLGTIACTIKMGYNRLSGEKGHFTPEWVYKLNDQLPTEITRETSLASLELLAQCQIKLYNHVENNFVDPSLTKFYLASWGYTDTMVWSKAHQDSKEEDLDSSPWPEDIVSKVQSIIKHYWLLSLEASNEKLALESSFDFPELNRDDIGLLSELLASRQPLYNSFQYLISHIMACLDHDSVTFRVKALRAMGRIAAEVPTILDEPRIRTPIIKRVHDISPSVRDAAVEVVAKYLGRQETLPLSLYNIVSERIMDTAMNVRKRLVKLLRELYTKCDDRAIKIDISAKLIQRIGDNEISISELALKATQEILFHPFREVESDGNDAFGSSYQHSPKERKRQITELTMLITGAVTRDISSPTQSPALIQILQKTVAGCDNKTMVWYKMIFQWIVDALFDHMLLLDEQGNTDGFLSCLTTDDWRIAQYVLMIYRDVLPRRKYHDPDFVAQVEQALQQLLSRCPLDMIQSTVSCLCAIIENISKRYNLLIKMLGSCLGKLQQDRIQMSNGKPPTRSLIAIRKMLLISSLLSRYFNFDEKRKTESVKMRALDLVHKQSITNLVFDLLLYFASSLEDTYSFNQITATALQSLGHFYAAYPTFVIDKTSTELMDRLFENGPEAMKIQLLHVFVEFLAAEENRIEKQEEVAGQSLHTKLIDVETLMGNTEEFSELGVNGSLMQRYFRRILGCALEKTPDIRYAAFDVIAAVVHQGLAHPVLCMPAIVAAETSSDITLRNKAYYLHRFAHDKYGPLLYSNFGDHISTAYEYQMLTADEKVQGYGKRGGDAKVDSLFALPFSILRQKKKIKLDFLCALVKPFDFDMKATGEKEINVNFLKFLAESIITLDFSMSEEILCVLNSMDRILMTVGADLLSSIQLFRKRGLIPKPNDMDEDGVPCGSLEGEIDPDYAMTAKTAIAMCIVLYVRELLMDLYSISNE
ncbi:sister chromatid cohesion C-terminus-domain-containing protein [Phycomyces nitens]|nr:sister chromatid cohesion C-terminus-domain-containing protein [Phycomyces nitens]